MTSEFIRTELRRLQRNRGILLAVFAGAFAAVLTLTWERLQRYDLGPQEMNRYQLLSLNNPDVLPNNYVAIKPDKLVNIGVSYEVSRRYNNETYYYHYAVFGEKVVLFESDRAWKDMVPEAAINMTVEPAAKRITNEIVPAILKDVPDISGYLNTTVMLRDESYRQSDAMWERSAMMVWAGLVAFFVAWYLLLLGRPEMVAVVRRLQKFGEVRNYQHDIDRELLLNAPQNTYHKIGVVQTTVTKSFMHVKLPMDAFIIPLEEIVWVYHKCYSYNGVVINTLVVHSASGVRLKVGIGNGNHEVAEDILKALYEANNEMFFGFSDEMNAAWKHDHNIVIQKWNQIKAQASVGMAAG